MICTDTADKRPHIVIIGAGFAGLEAAKGLKGENVKIIILDRNNYHLFQPLLYQVATAAIPSDTVVYPTRALLRGQKNARFRQAEVIDIDLSNRRVITAGGELPYQYLVVAPGSDTNFFSMSALADHSMGLKDVDEAIVIRNRVLNLFEAAARESDPVKRRGMLTFVVVGGGPAGVELAGALSELMHTVLVKDYPELNFAETRVVLLEAGQSLLPAMPAKLQKAAAESLRQKRVEVILHGAVADYDGEAVTMKNGEVLLCKTLLWAAGVRASKLVEKMGLGTASQSRVLVSSTLQAEGYPEVFIAGDAAHIEGKNGPLPMTAVVALQSGSHVAYNIKQLLHGRKPEPFRFRDLGSMAMIGRHAAVGKLSGVNIQGFIPWLLLLGVHLLKLTGMRNRLCLLGNWLWGYLFRDKPIRTKIRGS